MKRDWEIIRRILLKTEELGPGNSLRSSDFEYEPEITAYHVKLLKEAGLLEAFIGEFLGGGPPHFDLFSLTWSGHEFLDSIRDDNIWQETKFKVLDKSGSMTFEVIKSVAIELAKGLILS